MPHPTPHHLSAPADELSGTVAEIIHDLHDLAMVLPPDGGPADHAARIAGRLSEELAQAAAMIKSLPGRPAALAGYDWQLLAALRTSRQAGEDIAETIAHALARLAAELGGSVQVTANRPGSWEAERVADLLRGTVGPDDENLPMFGELA